VNLLGFLHDSFVHSRRVDVLARQLSAIIPPGASVLDVGCGDGRIAAQIVRVRPDVRITGIDVMKRRNAHIPVLEFDGVNIPFLTGSFDVVMFVDVLHHAADPSVLLQEARRIARNALLIKDHLKDGFAAEQTLRLMDWVGNARHGVALPYNYWTSVQWRQGMRALGVTATVWRTELHLYPAPASWIFERSLHFVAKLKVPGASSD
jgi:SAM-dependent methyltransferase